MIYTKESKLSEPIFQDPNIIAVINRFGIFPGVGDCSISEVCSREGLNVTFFLAVLNLYLNHDYFPSISAEDIEIEEVVNYLVKTDRYYVDIQLSNIDRHFNILLSRMEKEESPASNLRMLNMFFQEVKAELTNLVNKDLEQWFPNILRGEYSDFCAMQNSEETLEDKIFDLISFFVVHLKGEYDPNLCVAVISAICVLDRDIKQTNRIRQRLLRSMLGNPSGPMREQGSEENLKSLEE